MPEKKNEKIIHKILTLYTKDKLPIEVVAKQLGINKKTVKRYLIINNIDIRPRLYYAINDILKYNNKQLSFLDGFIFSDGTISYSNGNNSNIQGNFKYEEFALYISKWLGLSDPKAVVKKITKNTKNYLQYKKKKYVGYYIYSQSNIFFTQERDRWYKDGTKTIPQDCRFDPISLNIAYLCDGTISNKNGISLCTESFSKENLENTIIKFFTNNGIECWVSPRNRVVMSVQGSKDFLKYIGECPVKCYEHKWKVKPYMYHKTTKEELNSLYIDQKLSAREVGVLLNLSSAAIIDDLKKFNIPARTLKEARMVDWGNRQKIVGGRK